jgi:hypothetical protein
MLADEAKRDHQLKYPTYSYKPRKASEKKRRMSKKKAAALEGHGVGVARGEYDGESGAEGGFCANAAAGPGNHFNTFSGAGDFTAEYDVTAVEGMTQSFSDTAVQDFTTEFDSFPYQTECGDEDFFNNFLGHN